MKHIHKEHPYVRQDRMTDQVFDTSSVFFDIETTGFSPARAHIYLIGCARRDEETVYVDQFLAEDTAEEAAVLSAFGDILRSCRTVISYNGIGFDIPFLKAKCELYQLEDPFPELLYVDIFKAVSGLKFLLKLPNYKQKTLEHFMGLQREDLYSGGELINVYQDYCKSHSKEQEEILLLHNYEDVLGMADLLPVFSYAEIFRGNYTISEIKCVPHRTMEENGEKELLISLCNTFPVPRRVSCQFGDFYFMCSADHSAIRVPVFRGELHFFYPNYKDYYYLPQEDQAIHKSVAAYVDKTFRENARAANCYTRKTGEFLPQYEELMHPFFRRDYKDKVSYFALTDDFLTSNEAISDYTAHILKLLSGSKG
jgi:hypothetical protein